MTHPGGACALTSRGRRAQVPNPGRGFGGVQGGPLREPGVKVVGVERTLAPPPLSPGPSSSRLTPWSAPFALGSSRRV